MNDRGTERKQKRLDTGRSVGQSGGPHFNILYGFSEPQRGGWQGRLRSCPVVSHVMFFSEIGGISSKYSFFYRFALRTCSCGWTDERMDGWMDERLFVGDMSVDSSPALLSSSLSIPLPSTQPTQPNPTNPRRQSSMIILSNPHKQRRLESRRSDESGFSCPAPF